ncbi:GMC oxidoreductase-domain-containing protein [Pholiota molesta]|nr:GMC oxidoreductase-domain-containing protein [Pholiota molesta]
MWPLLLIKAAMHSDLNDFHTSNGYANWARFIDAKSGRRSDTAHYYVYNQTANTNFKVLAHQRVVRVLFECENRAVGVEYVSDDDRGQNAMQVTKVAYASKLVVLSAGAFGSPAILERSGIGAAKILQGTVSVSLWISLV